jgi:hypothetical protein
MSRSFSVRSLRFMIAPSLAGKAGRFGGCAMVVNRGRHGKARKAIAGRLPPLSYFAAF